MATTPITIINATITGMNANITGATITGEVETPEPAQPIEPPAESAPEHPIEPPPAQVPEHPIEEVPPAGPMPHASRSKKR
jgi:hypothetical protein